MPLVTSREVCHSRSGYRSSVHDAARVGGVKAVELVVPSKFTVSILDITAALPILSPPELGLLPPLHESYLTFEGGIVTAVNVVSIDITVAP